MDCQSHFNMTVNEAEEKINTMNQNNLNSPLEKELKHVTLSVSMITLFEIDNIFLDCFVIVEKNRCRIVFIIIAILLAIVSMRIL